MNEGEYLQEMNDMKRVFDEKDHLLKKEEKQNDFLKIEIVKLFGVVKSVITAARKESIEIAVLFNYLELLENRLEWLYEGLVLEEHDLED